MASRSYNIIVVPSDHSGTRQYSVSRALLLTLLVLVFLLLGCMAGFLVHYGRIVGKAAQAERLAQENQELLAQSVRATELSAEIEDLTALKAQILRMLGVADVEGGEPDLALADSERIDPDLDLVGLDHLKAAESLQSYAPVRWPVEGWISREFFQAEESADAHPGLDLVAPAGAPIHAAGAGKVVEASYDEWLGNYIVIDHGFGYSSLYGHNERLLVSAGQSVDQGQVIAYLGNTGRSSAPHLHFEIRVDGRPVDPRQYLGPK